MSSSMTPAQASAFLRTLPLDPPYIEVYLNGMYTTLFIFTVYSLWTHPRKAFRRSTWIPILFVLFACETIHSCVEWRIPSIGFQLYGATPQVINALIHPDFKLKLLGSLADIIGLLIPDAIMIWRCWVVWGRRWWIVIPPILASIAGAICAALSLAAQITISTKPNTTEAERLAPLVKFSLPFFSCCLAVTLYTTMLIMLRIWIVRRSSINASVENTDSSLSYATEILVESSAIYAASLLAYVVLLALKTEKQIYMQNINVQIAGIAPTLLVYRIALGHARQVDEWKAPVSIIRFATIPGTTSRVTGETSMAGNTVFGTEASQSRETGLPRLGKKPSQIGDSGSSGSHEKFY